MLSLLLCVLPLALAAPSEHIIGGELVDDPSRHPWQVWYIYKSYSTYFSL